MDYISLLSRWLGATRVYVEFINHRSNMYKLHFNTRWLLDTSAKCETPVNEALAESLRMNEKLTETLRKRAEGDYVSLTHEYEPTSKYGASWVLGTVMLAEGDTIFATDEQSAAKYVLDKVAIVDEGVIPNLTINAHDLPLIAAVSYDELELKLSLAGR